MAPGISSSVAFRSPIEADAPLREQHRAARREFNEHSDRHHDG
jgi:hypothetical protein